LAQGGLVIRRECIHAVQLFRQKSRAIGNRISFSRLYERGLPLIDEAEKTKIAPSAVAEMVLSFFSGLCIERNLKSGKISSTRKIDNFMTALRNL
jgi:hypothetical protein